MTPREILAECTRAGGSLSIDGGSLKASFPRGAIAREILAELREHRAEIIAHLEEQARTQQQNPPEGPISHGQDSGNAFLRPEGAEAHSAPPAQSQGHPRGPEQVIEYERKPGLRPCSMRGCRYFWQDQDGELHCLACEDPEGRMDGAKQAGALTWKLWEADMLTLPAALTSTGAEPATGAQAPRAVQQELFQ